MKRVIVVGNVDDGKSTLVGRLLFESRQVADDQLSALEKLSRARGRGDLDLTLLTDGLRAEREQGVTIDVAYRHFNLGGRRLLLIDAPGHVQYTRNMFTGATNADIALILVDVSRGFTEQTFRHCMLCGMLGVRDIILLLNKMDLMKFSEDTYSSFVAEARERLEGVVSVREVIPVSGLNGDNVIARSQAMAWYNGPTVAEALSTATDDRIAGAFVMPVQGVEAIRGAQGKFERWITGRVWSGSIRTGDEIQIQPSGQASHIEEIRVADEILQLAETGTSVALKIRDDIEISRGDILAAAGAVLDSGTLKQVRLFWMAKSPLKLNSPYLVIQGRRTFQALLSNADSLAENQLGTATLTASAPMVTLNYADNRLLGSFVVVDPATKNTVAGGITI